ncbi:MAG TPA: hypothetical protein VN721_02940 [Flavipsychrobacter sp.]|nr:hypothetical protein [Flavipsychrobacter sp.]
MERQKEGVSIFGPQFTPIKGTNEDFESIERIFTLWVLCTDSYYALSFSHSYFLCLSKESNQRKDTFCPNAPQDKRICYTLIAGDCFDATLERAGPMKLGTSYLGVWCSTSAGCFISIKPSAWVREILHYVQYDNAILLISFFVKKN